MRPAPKNRLVYSGLAILLNIKQAIPIAKSGIETKYAMIIVFSFIIVCPPLVGRMFCRNFGILVFGVCLFCSYLFTPYQHDCKNWAKYHEYNTEYE